jgi:hypothetical protein
MSKKLSDVSFERDGRNLSAWLQDLVAEDAPSRRAAGEALQAMMYGVPSIHTDVTQVGWNATMGQGDRFNAAVRKALRAPDFPTSDFVRRLILYRIALKDDWHQRIEGNKRELETPSPREEILWRRLEAAGDEAERREECRRYLRWLCASLVRTLERGKDRFAGAESMSPAGIAAGIVFDALGEVLLSDRPGLRVMLEDKEMFQHAAKTLVRIGPPAVDFAGLLLERLDADQARGWFEGAEALGSIGRDDPAVIDQLLKRLASGPEAVRIGAAQALGHAGPPLAGRLPAALDILIGATYKPHLAHAAIPALASVGRDSDEALRRVLEWAEPREPRWQTYENYPDYRYDEVMHERGLAIEALAHFRHYASRVVPVLIDAFDTFEEYDPDWTYGGEHERVCWALRQFGPDAVPAVPRLVRYLDEWLEQSEKERPWPKDVFGLLATIGPRAAAALPALDRLRALENEGYEESSSDLDPNNPLDQAIVSLRSEG